jgi:hypothetical protein
MLGRCIGDGPADQQSPHVSDHHQGRHDPNSHCHIRHELPLVLAWHNVMNVHATQGLVRAHPNAWMKLVGSQEETVRFDRIDRPQVHFELREHAQQSPRMTCLCL